MFLSDLESLTYTSSTISSCTAWEGGGMRMELDTLTNEMTTEITDVQILSCSAGLSGGGIDADGIELNLNSVNIHACSAGDSTRRITG